MAGYYNCNSLIGKTADQMTADYIGIMANGRLGYEGIMDESQDLEQLFMKIVAAERGAR